MAIACVSADRFRTKAEETSKVGMANDAGAIGFWRPLTEANESRPEAVHKEKARNGYLLALRGQLQASRCKTVADAVKPLFCLMICACVPQNEAEVYGRFSRFDEDGKHDDDELVGGPADPWNWRQLAFGISSKGHRA